MINFTLGPVQMEEEIRSLGAKPIPYFRTPEFSEMMKENERILKRLVDAKDDARAVFLTASGTAAMEAAVMQLFSADDRVLILNGGTFGQRFVDLCALHQVFYTEIRIPFGKNITREMLEPFSGASYTAMLVNVLETSTGVLYDMELLSSFCRENHLFFVVDAIGNFLAEPFSMKTLGVSAAIVSSQKALACPPGVAALILERDAIWRVERSSSRCMYLDIRRALEDGKRGQTPFTPAVGILQQMHMRFLQLEADCGAQVRQKSQQLAEDFRKKSEGLPLNIASESLSCALTPLRPVNGKPADLIVQKLKQEYQIWVCPNGGELREHIFRVGHLGSLTTDDNTKLVDALWDLAKRGYL